MDRYDPFFPSFAFLPPCAIPSEAQDIYTCNTSLGLLPLSGIGFKFKAQ